MTRTRTVFGQIILPLVAAPLLACSSGVSLAGDQDVSDSELDDRTPGADADGDATIPDAVPDAAPDTVSDAGEARDGDPDPDADAGAAEDATWDATDTPPDATTAHLVPDEMETFFDFGDPGSWRDSAVPMHRHSFPVAWSGSAYAVVLEDRSGGTDVPGPIAVFRFERGVEGLHEMWVDDEPEITEYNSICWTGEAFVVALPTFDVGLRVLALDGAGSLIRPPQLLAADATYVPAAHGEAPVVLCPDSGAFVLEPGRGAGGLDRLYGIAPDGTASGGFVDADVPTFARNLYFAPVPCATSGDDVACATDAGLAFVRGDGSARAADPLSGAPVCGSPTGCDTAATGSDVFLVGGRLMTWPESELVLARWSVDGGLALPTVEVDSTGGSGPEAPRVRAAASGTTVLAVTFGGGFVPDGTNAWLVGRDGTPMDRLAPLPACAFIGGEPECFGHSYAEGGTVFWEGDAYAALWITGRGVAYRRLALAW